MKNIIVAFLNFIFYFLFLFFSLSLFLSSTRLFIFFFSSFFLLHTRILYFSLSPLLTFLYTFLLHPNTPKDTSKKKKKNTPEDQASRIHPLSFQNIPFLFSLSLLSSTHSATQPTPTHFFILIFTCNLGRRQRKNQKKTKKIGPNQSRETFTCSNTVRIV